MVSHLPWVCEIMEKLYVLVISKTLSTGTDEFSTTPTTIPGLSNVKRGGKSLCGLLPQPFAYSDDGTLLAAGR